MASKTSSPAVHEAEVSDSSDDDLEACTTPGPSLLQHDLQTHEQEVEGTLGWDAGSHSHAAGAAWAHQEHQAPDVHRAAGNAALAAGDCNGALRSYARGLAKPSPSPRHAAILHSNMAATHLRMGAAAEAAAACERAHRLCPDWHKPLFRLVQARLVLRQWAAAAAAARRGAELAGPADVPSFQALLDEVAVAAFVAGSMAGFHGVRLEVRSAGDEAWLGGPAPHDPGLDGPEASDPGEVIKSLREAVAAAEDGDVIVLLAGIHNGMGEAVTVTKRLLIQGQGRLGDAVIDQRANSPTFRISRGGVVLHNLTLDQTGFKETLCIAGTVRATGPLVLGCVVKCSGDDAVNVCEQAAPLFVDCELTARKSGMRAFDSAAPRLLRCTVEKCGEAGVKLMDDTTCDLTDCVVQKCEEDGVVVMDSAVLTCSQTVVSGCKGPGVDLSGHGSAVLTRGTVAENVGGVWLWDRAQARLDGMRLEGGSSHAIMLYEEGATLVAKDCGVCGTMHGPEGVLQGVSSANRVTPPGRHTGWPVEDGPFQFVPNQFTRKQ